MPTNFEIEILAGIPDSVEVQDLLQELSDELAAKTGRDGRNSFRLEDVAAPRSAFLVAKHGRELLGCGALRPISREVCEIKRMYARNKGQGIGGSILKALEKSAIEFGYDIAWLETGIENRGAVGFYLQNGFKIRENFGKYKGRPECVCFEKRLSRAKATPSTRLNSLLGLEVPLVQAPIGSATTVALVSEVSKAGALGMLSGTWRSTEELRSMIREIKSRTVRPFGVNFVLTIDPMEKIRMCLEEGVRVISFFWGDPRPYIPEVHGHGALVMHTIGDAEEAANLRGQRIDILVAQGIEAGGHVCGRSELFSLIPAVREVVGDSVLVAAGGLGNPNAVRKALECGADGVGMGTRFLASLEADVHPLFQQRILRSQASDTVYSTLFDGGWPNAPHRVLRTEFVAQWEKDGYPKKGHRREEDTIIGYRETGNPVRAYEDSFATSGTVGAIEKFPFYAGQSVGQIESIQTAAEIIESIRLELASPVPAAARSAEH